jgi:hypothetical protein
MYNGIIVYAEGNLLGHEFYSSFNTASIGKYIVECAGDVLNSYRRVNELLNTQEVKPVVFVVREYNEEYFPVELFKGHLRTDIKVEVIYELPSLLHCIAKDYDGFKKAVSSITKSSIQGFCDRISRGEARMGCSYKELVSCVDIKKIITHQDNNTVFGALVENLDVS